MSSCLANLPIGWSQERKLSGSSSSLEVLTHAFHLLCPCLVYSRRKRLALEFPRVASAPSLASEQLLPHQTLLGTGELTMKQMCWRQFHDVDTTEIASQRGWGRLKKWPPNLDLKYNRMRQGQQVERREGKDHLTIIWGAQKSPWDMTETCEEWRIGLKGRCGLSKQDL